MSNARHKIMLVSLGCDKNLVDSEMMLGMLSEAGFEITNDEQEAEVVIVNTCCFIMDAKEESITTLIEYGKLKENAKCRALIATGCLAQRYADEILKRSRRWMLWWALLRLIRSLTLCSLCSEVRYRML